MKTLAIVILISTVLFGCATQKKYQTILDTWVGHPEHKLVRSWGPPQSVYESEGVKYLTYTNSRNVVLGQTNSSYTTTVIGNTAYTTGSPGSPGRNYAMTCQTTFEIRDGVIQSWSYKGNDCTAN